MGKKSKSKSTKQPRCYHGCLTKKEFNSGAHYQLMEKHDELSNHEERVEFNKKYKCVLTDSVFGDFLIARITNDFLKGKDDDIIFHRLCLLVEIRYQYIPEHEGKDVGPESEYTKNFQKYSRDIMTKRGRINVIARGIPCDCRCMDEKKKEAKLMEKTAGCFGCTKEFSKEKMLRCKGCEYYQYCSEECSKNDWPEHKDWCKLYSVSSAPTPTPTPTSVPSSCEESTDVDAKEE